MQILLMRSRYLEPKRLMRKQTSRTAQKVRTVCQALGRKSSCHRVMALRMSCPPLKQIERVTVQLPTRFLVDY